MRSVVDGSIARFAHKGELEVGGRLDDHRLLLGWADSPVILDLNTGRMSTLHARCFHPDPAPDGRRFTCLLLPHYRIAIGESGSRRLRFLALPRRILANYPAWSPDGQVIAFGNQNDRSNDGMYVIRPDGTDLQRVANGFLGFAFWRP